MNYRLRDLAYLVVAASLGIARPPHTHVPDPRPGTTRPAPLKSNFLAAWATTMPIVRCLTP
jgi:hypothetical protein